jgi:hypothetical protein
MRASALIGVMCCVPLFCVTIGSATATSDVPPKLLRAEVAQDSAQDGGDDRWEGRRHYLYDEQYRPQTDGTGPVIKGCTEERVRVRRSDGVTAIKRINRCE